MLEIRIESEVHWDGERLAVWSLTPTSRILCEIPRDTIHRIPLYSDAIDREIARDKEEIVDRIKACLIAKVAGANGATVRLTPSDVSGI